MAQSSHHGTRRGRVSLLQRQASATFQYPHSGTSVTRDPPFHHILPLSVRFLGHEPSRVELKNTQALLVCLLATEYERAAAHADEEDDLLIGRLRCDQPSRWSLALPIFADLI